MSYNDNGVNALDKVRRVVQDFGLPFTARRKFNGILNAIEMQVEDYEYGPEVLDNLIKALLVLADFYHLSDERAKLETALAQFQRELRT
jgi:hypothetical protein